MQLTLSDTFVAHFVTGNLPTVLSKDSKEPDAQKIRLLSNSVYIMYLEAPDSEKLTLLEDMLQKQNELLALINSHQALTLAEINKYRTPLSLATD